MRITAQFQGETTRDILARLSTLAQYRELIWMLAWRDIRVRYKHASLGAAWAVVPPALTMLIFTFVFSKVVNISQQALTGEPTLPYALFAFSGLVPWMFCANGLTAATLSMVANRQLVTKIYFPREVFPIAAIGSAFVDFLIASLVTVIIAVGLHIAPNGWTYRFDWPLLCTPIVVAVQIMLMVGLGLLLSMANLFYRDVGFLFRSLIQLWMFVTCVLYQLDGITGWKRVLIQFNPMTPIIRAYRDCLILGRSPFDAAFLNAAILSAISLVIGWWWFRRREFAFAEHI